MKKITLILFLSLTLFANHYPKIFSQLGTPLFKQLNNFEALKNNTLFRSEQELIQEYKTKADKALLHGQALDKKESNDIKAYLKELRHLQQLHDKIEKVYKHKLYKSINDKNSSAFYSITSTPLPFIRSDARLKKCVVHYYKTTQNKKITFLEDLVKDYKLDKDSYALLEAMFKTRQRNLKVKTRKQLNNFEADPLRKNPIEVIMLRVKNGFDLYLENHAYYNVTIQLKTPTRKNLSSSHKLPYTHSFPPQSRTKLISFTRQDPHKASAVQTVYSSLIGRLNPSYDDSYIYALPYKRGKSYLLTQGFNGKHTHKGQSAYALDFKMDVGTPVHAMREGTVIAVESKHTQHGYSKAFLNKANHIVIEHADGTMAMYAHLKPNGVKVKLGQKVKKHQYIGLSGNTGFSSGPHLHVHISAIKSFKSGSTSVPFKFKTKSGLIKNPIEKSAYICK